MSIRISQVELDNLVLETLVKECSLTKERPCFCSLLELCHCGCGQQTSLATQSDYKHGYIIHRPNKYIRWHYRLDKNRSACKYGHEFTESNTFLSPSGGKYCITCRKEDKRLFRYGITREQYTEILKRQAFKCAICKINLYDESMINKAPDLDHNHNTNQVNGILCHNCNIGIGFLQHNTEIIETAAQYVRLYYDT